MDNNQIQLEERLARVRAAIARINEMMNELRAMSTAPSTQTDTVWEGRVFEPMTSKPKFRYIKGGAGEPSNEQQEKGAIYDNV